MITAIDNETMKAFLDIHNPVLTVDNWFGTRAACKEASRWPTGWQEVIEARNERGLNELISGLGMIKWMDEDDDGQEYECMEPLRDVFVSTKTSEDVKSVCGIDQKCSPTGIVRVSNMGVKYVEWESEGRIFYFNQIILDVIGFENPTLRVGLRDKRLGILVEQGRAAASLDTACCLDLLLYEGI